jgi:uncharacterized protein (DUF1800 family)
MTRSASLFATVLLLGGAIAVSSQYAAARKKETRNAASRMDEHQRSLHALNRLAFGPRPGDVERVTQMGVDKWIDQQLHPEKIDDSALQAKLEPLRTLRMSTPEMVSRFPPEPVIKAVAAGKLPMPNDPERKAVYQAQLYRLQLKNDRKQEKNGAGTIDNAKPDSPDGDPPADQRRAARENLQALLGLPPDARVKRVLQMPPEQLRPLESALRGDKAAQFLDGMSAEQRETMLALSNPQRVVQDELDQGKLLRAIYSQRQLDEVMTDFWFNHFNVFINKGEDRYLVTSYERDVIRPHALGKFEDLLVATAKSPAMMFYLDNWMSVGPDSPFAMGDNRKGAELKRASYKRPGPAAKNEKGKRGSGLNENYGRELMELHTLGVSGGYRQKDVTEVAKVFTGWTLKQPREGAGVDFDERMHEPGDKTVLGHRIKQAGEKEGLEVLHLLAHHPSTAHFVCTKLATRFVSDNPPKVLVDRMAQTFLKKDGDIREVLKTMLRSEEFWAADTYRAKVKTPLEFVASAARASDAEVSDATPLIRQLQAMGMPPYAMQPPTGYSMKAETWVNSSALLGRMNFALALANDKMKGVQVDAWRTLGGAAPADAEQMLAAMENAMLAGDVSRQTHDTIEKRLQDPQISQRQLDDPARPANAGMIEGLLLGSPEFQKR